MDAQRRFPFRWYGAALAAALIVAGCGSAATTKAVSRLSTEPLHGITDLRRGLGSFDLPTRAGPDTRRLVPFWHERGCRNAWSRPFGVARAERQGNVPKQYPRVQPAALIAPSARLASPDFRSTAAIASWSTSVSKPRFAASIAVELTQ